ncbi:hypothetical protein JYQ62_24815 [Nostoc sp. UHCC 0702]|nr:hypothetical protein JYQ62_24815 [Nostoc sp. UHCC 0702]
MKPSDEITLQAFLKALSQLEKPLPREIQQRLNEIGKTLKTHSTNLDNLDNIAESYKPLDELYQKELTAFNQVSRVKSKGLSPEELPKQPTPEIVNTATDVFSADDSVAEAKKTENIIKRLWRTLKDNL